MVKKIGEKTEGMLFYLRYLICFCSILVVRTSIFPVLIGAVSFKRELGPILFKSFWLFLLFVLYFRAKKLNK